MIKKLTISISVLVIMIIGINVSYGQSIPTISPWKVLSGIITPVTSTSQLKVPQLGGSGDKCLHVDNTGLFSTAPADCGSGGGGVTGGTAGMLASWVNSTTLTATSTPTVSAIFATSTTATSYFAGLLNVLGLTTLGNASTTQLTTTGSTYLATGGGRVGIGTTTPAYKLEVADGTDRTIVMGKMVQGPTYNGISLSGSTVEGMALGLTGGAFGDNSLYVESATGGDINFRTGATGTYNNRMIVTNAGKVGIGTTNPTSPLHINTPTKTGALHTMLNISLSDNNVPLYSADELAIDFSKNYVGNNYLLARITGSNTSDNDYSSAGFMAFSTLRSGVITEAMRILSTGRIGVGTTNPFSKFSISNGGAGGFEFEPDITAYGTANSNYIASYDRANSLYRPISFDTGNGSGPTLFLQDGGRVGIGTTTGLFSQLNIAAHGGTGSFLTFKDMNAGGQSWAIGPGAGTGSPDDFNVYNFSYGTLMRLGNNAHLAIGTTDITRPFTVTGPGPQVYLSTSGTYGASGGGVGIGYNAAGNYASYQPAEWGVAYGDNVFNPDGGNVGIGTTNPAYKLSVSNGGAAGLEFDPTGTLIAGGVGIQAYDRNASAFKPFQLYGSSILLNGGNVGIGTTTPYEKLSVAGNGIFDGSLTVGATSASASSTMQMQKMQFEGKDSGGTLRCTFLNASGAWVVIAGACNQ